MDQDIPHRRQEDRHRQDDDCADDGPFSGGACAAHWIVTFVIHDPGCAVRRKPKFEKII
ncbi:MAG TPA: hypothetical protein VF070_24770 [Streptosporangiaceae bacterium]